LRSGAGGGYEGYELKCRCEADPNRSEFFTVKATITGDRFASTSAECTMASLWRIIGFLIRMPTSETEAVLLSPQRRVVLFAPEDDLKAATKDMIQSLKRRAERDGLQARVSDVPLHDLDASSAREIGSTVVEVGLWQQKGGECSSFDCRAWVDLGPDTILGTEIEVAAFLDGKVTSAVAVRALDWLWPTIKLAIGEEVTRRDIASANHKSSRRAVYATAGAAAVLALSVFLLYSSLPVSQTISPEPMPYHAVIAFAGVSATVREAPSFSSRPVASLATDHRYVRVGVSGEWYQVAPLEEPRSPIGFVHRSAVQLE
jgi:hypothetical protein